MGTPFGHAGKNFCIRGQSCYKGEAIRGWASNLRGAWPCNRVQIGKSSMTSMKSSLSLSILLAASVWLAPLSASASGSFGPGSGAMSSANANYARGKAIVFRELVCKTCPIQKSGFGRERAKSLLDSLASALQKSLATPEDDAAVKSLCQGQAGNCAAKLKQVRYYLQRRYRLAGL